MVIKILLFIFPSISIGIAVWLWLNGKTDLAKFGVLGWLIFAVIDMVLVIRYCRRYCRRY